MKRLLAGLLACAAVTASAQEARPRPHERGPRWQPAMQYPVPPGGGMSWEERQRLRDELKAGRREGYREGGRMPQADPRRQAPHHPMPPEEREQLRRDLREANREFGGRR